MYEEYNFPLSVAVTPPSNCSHLVYRTAAALANEVASRASNNPARMYVYNLLVLNNWSNQEFQELLNNILWYMYLEVMKGNYNSPEMALKDCVNKYATMYTSTFILTVDAVKSAVSDRHIDASVQNAEIFQNLKLEINHMHNQQYHNQSGYPNQQGHGHMQPQHPQQPQHWQQPQHFQQPMPMQQQPQHWQQPMQQPQHWQHPQPMPMHHHHQPQQRFPNTPMQPGGSFMHQTAPQNINVMAAGSGNSEVVNERFGKLANSQKTYFEEPVYNSQPVKQVQALDPEIKQQIEDLVFKKGNEMDRAQHTITFMGQKYPMNTVVRTNNFNEQTVAISKASVLAEEDKLNVDADNVILDINEETAILRGQSRHLERDPTKIFRCFAIISNAIISKEFMADYVKNLSESRDLSQLSGRMSALAEAFNKLSAKSGVVNEHDSKIVVLTAIDRRLTDLVNNFVNNNLQLEKISIDSFVEDYNQLEQYISDTCGPMGSLAIRNFGQEVMHNLFGTDVDELVAEAKSLLDLPDDLDCVFLPENYSLTYLPLTDKELDYDLKDRLWTVSHARTPLLATILDSLTLHKKQGQQTCLHDLVITQDGAIYRVYENSLGKGYLIRKG
jgi:hypothetical protein